jgi:hypothetical protein
MITRHELEELIAAWDALVASGEVAIESGVESVERIRVSIEALRQRLEAPDPALEAALRMRGDEPAGEPDPDVITVDPRAKTHVVGRPDAYSSDHPPTGQALELGDVSDAIRAFRQLFVAAQTFVSQGPSPSGMIELEAAVRAARPFVR